MKFSKNRNKENEVEVEEKKEIKKFVKKLMTPKTKKVQKISDANSKILQEEKDFEALLQK